MQRAASPREIVRFVPKPGSNACRMRPAKRDPRYPSTAIVYCRFELAGAERTPVLLIYCFPALRIERAVKRLAR